MSEEKRYIRCAPFTRAQRQAQTIGDVWGYRGWPLPLTIYQFGGMLGAAAIMVFTERLWAHFGLTNLLIAFVVEIIVMYGSRSVRIEGRTPWAAGLGVGMAAMGRPRINGKRYRERTVTRYKARKMLLVPDEHWHRYPFAIVEAKHAQGRARWHVRRNYWQRRAA